MSAQRCEDDAVTVGDSAVEKIGAASLGEVMPQDKGSGERHREAVSFADVKPSEGSFGRRERSVRAAERSEIIVVLADFSVYKSERDVPERQAFKIVRRQSRFLLQLTEDADLRRGKLFGFEMTACRGAPCVGNDASVGFVEQKNARSVEQVKRGHGA